MIYKGPFRDIIYPSQSREPHVTRYRIVLAKNPRLVRAIVHLVADELKWPCDAAKRPTGTTDEPIHIRSHDIVGGVVAFYVDQDEGNPASAIVERLLR
ncbi:hypothetical protein SB861_43300 [Paraburkholderia sp. SIMBA_049]